MATTAQGARDEMYGAFDAVWEEYAAGVFNTDETPRIQFADVEDTTEQPDPICDYWVRVSHTVLDKQRASIKGPCGQRHRVTGLLQIEIFGPRSIADAGDRLIEMSDLLERYLLKRINHVLLRDVVGRGDSAPNRVNRRRLVTGIFEYDTLTETVTA